MPSLSTFSPAKINLFLAVTGRREDGYHNLVSVAAPLDWGDSLRFAPGREGEGFRLECDRTELSCGEDNLVLRAAKAFAAACGGRGAGRFILEKRIPVGAGLGGGSSNAAAALRLLNLATGKPLIAAELEEIAAGIGSDCPLFLAARPVVMRGRGELLTPLEPDRAKRLTGRRILLFKPPFGIGTAWAYAQMAAGAPASYLHPSLAEERLTEWLAKKDATAEELLFNNMEAVAFEKYLALPTLIHRLQGSFGLAPRMSGSGSACFALLPDSFDCGPAVDEIRAAWGPSAFVVEARLV